MNEELAYSIHLGSDKNKTTKAKEIAKTNPSSTTSFSNNGIQNSTQLSKVNKHNLRDYDNNKELIEVIYGTNNLYNDVQQIYIQEFEQSRIEYNEKQNREDRKIQNYFKHISDSKLWDLACEFIIELGDMDYWQDKDINFKMKMIDVYKEQVKYLMNIVPEFKVANAVIHFDETSPHLHLVGIPVSNHNKRGMKKQVAKSKIFTKESLTEVQDKMRNACIKSYNKVYEKNSNLKQKQKGRNKDINVKDMKDYAEFKKQYESNKKRLMQANKKTEKVEISSEEVNSILDKLKTSTFNKNNRVISNEDIEKIKNYVVDIKDTVKSIKSVNDLNYVIEDFETSYNKISNKNHSLEYQVQLQNNEIIYLKEEVSSKDKIINKLQTEKGKLKEELQKFKEFWFGIIKHFQEKIYLKDDKFKYVSEELYNKGLFDKNEYEITNDLARKIKTTDEIRYSTRQHKKKNDWDLK